MNRMLQPHKEKPVKAWLLTATMRRFIVILSRLSRTYHRYHGSERTKQAVKQAVNLDAEGKCLIIRLTHCCAWPILEVSPFCLHFASLPVYSKASDNSATPWLSFGNVRRTRFSFADLMDPRNCDINPTACTKILRQVHYHEHRSYSGNRKRESPQHGVIDIREFGQGSQSRWHLEIRETR